MLATPEDILSDLSRDLDALAREHRVLDDMKDELGVMFVDRAAEKVRRQMERAVELSTNALRAAIAKAREELMDVLRRAEQRGCQKREHGRDATRSDQRPSTRGINEEIPEAFHPSSWLRAVASSDYVPR